jgi:hypothetical protein
MQIVEAGQPNELITHNGFLETADTLLFSAAADFGGLRRIHQDSPSRASWSGVSFFVPLFASNS